MYIECYVCIYIYYIVFVSCMWCGCIFKYSAIIEIIETIYILSSIFVLSNMPITH